MKIEMKKKMIYIGLVIAVLLVGVVCFTGKPSSLLRSDKQSDKITGDVSDKEEILEETEGIKGMNGVDGVEIPLENEMEEDQSQTEFPSEDDGDVELPAVPIQ